MSEQNYSFLDATGDRELIRKLQTATQNLFWLSEAEYPWEIFYWHNADTFNENILLQQSNCSSIAKIAIQQLSDFLNLQLNYRVGTTIRKKRKSNAIRL